jgi:hypothetical protein
MSLNLGTGVTATYGISGAGTYFWPSGTRGDIFRLERHTGTVSLDVDYETLKK